MRSKRKRPPNSIGLKILSLFGLTILITLTAVATELTAFSFGETVKAFLGGPALRAFTAERSVSPMFDHPWSYDVSPTTTSVGALTLYTVTVTNEGTNCGNEAIGSFELTFPSPAFTLGTVTVISAGNDYHWTGSVVGNTVMLTANDVGDKLCAAPYNVLVFTIQATATTSVGSPFTLTGTAYHNPNWVNLADPPTDGQKTITVTPCIAPAVTADPIDQTVTYGTASVQFTASTSGSSPAPQWQVDTGSGFTNLADGAPYSGVGTNTLSIANATVSMSGYQYRVVYTNFCGTDTSAAATLTVNKANATIAVVPYDVTYDGLPHAATGTATGAFGENLNALLDLSGTTHTNAGSYPTDPWSFLGDANHNGATGTVADNIGKANALCSVTGYDVPYDGMPHTATGSCTGVGGQGDILAGLDLSGTTHTAAGSYPTDPWVFTDVTGNYINQSGTVADNISRSAAAVCTVTGYNVTYDGLPHTATGQCLGVLGEPLTGLDLSGTTHTAAGSYPSDPWTFTDVTGNYDNQSGTVADNIAKADASCSVTGYNVAYDGLPHTATGVCTGVGGSADILAGLDLSGTTHTAAGSYPADPWVFTDVTGNYSNQSGTVADNITRSSAAVCTVTGYNVTYDGLPHTATGQCLGVLGEPLAGLDLSGTTHTAAGNYPTDPWVFTDVTGNYENQSGTVTDNIGKANANCSVTGYNVAYDGLPHTATGTCTGVGGQGDILAGLDLSGTTHIAAGSYPTDPWVFTDVTGNYSDQSGSVADSITRSSAVVCTISGYNVTYDGIPHTATGQCLGVLGEPLAGLDLSGTTHTAAGSYPNDPWVFTDVTGNYNNQSGTIADNIGKANAQCSVTGYNVPYDGQPHTATGACTGVGGQGDILSGLDLSGTTHTAAGSYPSDPWTFTDVTGNYNNQGGTVADNITRSSAAVCTVTGYDVIYDGLPHTATGQCLGVLGEPLAGLDLSGTTHTDPGTYPEDPWIFIDVAGNYANKSGTVFDRIRNPLADLSITKTDGLTVVSAGEPVTYTIVASNAGPTAVVGATVTDAFPGTLTGVTWTCVGTAGGTCPPSGSGNINSLVDLPPGGSATFTAAGTVPPGTLNPSLVNTAVITAPQSVIDPNLANNSATDSTMVRLRGDLAITKTDNRTNLTPGSQTTYTIVVTNNGPAPAVDAVVTDIFPAGVVVTNWTCLPQNWAFCTLAGAGNINDTVYIPVGGILTYTAIATTDFALTGQLVNTATVTPPDTLIDPNLVNNTSTDIDNFVISISGNVKHFVEGGPNGNLGGVTMTLSGSNTGTVMTDASGNYTFTDLTSGGTWTVTPAMTNEVFDPTNRHVSGATANVTGVDFLAYDWSSAIRNVFVVSTHAVPGEMVTVPIRMHSKGTEMYMSFSIDYPSTTLNTPVVTCGESVPGCSIVSLAGTPGKLGVLITTPTAVDEGLREIGKVTFHTHGPPVPNAPLVFTDDPMQCELKDGLNNDLPVTWTSGFVVFMLGVENDVASRNSGDGDVLATDVTQVRRFVAGLDVPNPAFNEFQRADSAPKDPLGDGQLLAGDVVQARRDAARLDGLRPAGGPGGPPLPPLGSGTTRPAVESSLLDTSRTIRLSAVSAGYDDITFAATLDPVGDEAAVAFTLEFDTARLQYVSTALGDGMPVSSALTVNDGHGVKGRIGILVDSMEPFAKDSAPAQLVLIRFRVKGNAQDGKATVMFTNGVARKGLADTLGNTLLTRYVNGGALITGGRPW